MTHSGLFERTAILVNDHGIEALKKAHVLLAGVGGVGSFAAEALARSGIGNITLIDHDVVSSSNLNRQLVALNSNIGVKKAEIMRDRIKDINPNCNVTIIDDFIRPDDMDNILNQPYDFVIDAIDSLSCKVAFVRGAHERGYRVISSMGAGGKLDPTQIKVADIYKTSVCKLARVMRVRLRRQKVKKGILAVYSTEKPIAPLPPEPVPGEGRDRAVNGTISYLPALFGLTIAGKVIQEIIANQIHQR
ncbi:tRNA threonylcarbamoyladenosine dehydratase [Fangia hongkongensis]|uniref:tRNA threonylcarbamoyladenosine dehydratase n=1 Tax=Fangia hongkongensis TaxID=270495 RepID=UPI000377773C|nr:tRNA threonylcarbamoyladenosine dehydratase [Fangia hongkongensis]MBK2125594.1 tRNA threonylcarbamoyladenosine dehydratase [Fangia hongkongensis]